MVTLCELEFDNRIRYFFPPSDYLYLRTGFVAKPTSDLGFLNVLLDTVSYIGQERKAIKKGPPLVAIILFLCSTAIFYGIIIFLLNASL
jgi:hypothetical protein